MLRFTEFQKTKREMTAKEFEAEYGIDSFYSITEQNLLVYGPGLVIEKTNDNYNLVIGQQQFTNTSLLQLEAILYTYYTNEF